jgi:hypothetical protein
MRRSKPTKRNWLSKILIIAGIIAVVPLLPGLLYVCAVFIAPLLGPLGFQGETHTFFPQFEDGAKRADVLFAQHGLCKVWHHQCPDDKNALYAFSTTDSLTVWIYGVSDPQLLEQLKQIFLDEYRSTPAMKHLRITAYPISKSEERKVPILQRPIEHAVLNLDAGRDD